MRTLHIFSLAAFLVCGILAPAVKAQDVVIEARLFKGSRQAQVGGSDVVVSSFVDPLLVSKDPARIRTEQGQIAAMRAELFDIYHLLSVNHITTSRFIWDGEKGAWGGPSPCWTGTIPSLFIRNRSRSRGCGSGWLSTGSRNTNHSGRIQGRRNRSALAAHPSAGWSRAADRSC